MSRYRNGIWYFINSGNDQRKKITQETEQSKQDIIRKPNKKDGYKYQNIFEGDQISDVERNILKEYN